MKNKKIEKINPWLRIAIEYVYELPNIRKNYARNSYVYQYAERVIKKSLDSYKKNAPCPIFFKPDPKKAIKAIITILPEKRITIDKIKKRCNFTNKKLSLKQLAFLYLTTVKDFYETKISATQLSKFTDEIMHYGNFGNPFEFGELDGKLQDSFYWAIEIDYYLLTEGIPGVIRNMGQILDGLKAFQKIKKLVSEK